MSAYLADAARTKELLTRYGFFTKKGYGQNFLILPQIPEGIAAAAGLTKEDTVLEIGPGIGTLTQVLAEKAGRVIAVELDQKLKPLLSETLSDYENITLIWGDILKQDLDALFAELNVTPPVKVVANLPYYITTPILLALLPRRDLFSSLTVMVQEEVAERMAAGPGGKDYGYLSLSVQYYAEPKAALTVPRHAFYPQPKVDSAVVQLTARKERPACKDPEHLFLIMKAAFQQRRKTLANALSGYPPAGVDRETVCVALTGMGLDPQIRGERLSLEQFAELSDRLREARKQNE